jgi:hypothetical protein
MESNQRLDHIIAKRKSSIPIASISGRTGVEIRPGGLFHTRCATVGRNFPPVHPKAKPSRDSLPAKPAPTAAARIERNWQKRHERAIVQQEERMLK